MTRLTLAFVPGLFRFNSFFTDSAIFIFNDQLLCDRIFFNPYNIQTLFHYKIVIEFKHNINNIQISNNIIQRGKAITSLVFTEK